MKTITRLLILSSIFLSIPTFAEDFKFEADWDSIRAGYECPEWFKDAKFGIFLHWGPYAVPAYHSEKYPKYMYYPKHERHGRSAYKHHLEHYGSHADFGYKDFIPLFKAENFDAEEWVALFEEAGAKYVVPVAEHHDGFAMYASKHTRWNVADMGPKKDTMRMLADATRAAGLKFGASSHFANNRGYFSKKDPTFDTNDPAYADLYAKPIKKGELPSEEFMSHWWDRTTDIIDQYEPDVLWFDFGLDKPGWDSMYKPILAYFYNMGLRANKSVVFQNKNMRNDSFPEDLIVLDIERGRMSDIRELPWQTDTAVGKTSWGYIEGEDYKTSDYLLDELIDIVSKNGCLLLNIGPKADGTIAEPDQAILREIGAWLKVNGEAVYGTRPWKLFGEGPTKVSTGHHSEKYNADNVAADIRFTVKGDALYATSLAWPSDGQFTIKSLASGNAYDARAIQSVEFLSGGNAITWEQTGEGLVLNVNGNKPCEAAYVFKVTFKSDKAEVKHQWNAVLFLRKLEGLLSSEQQMAFDRLSAEQTAEVTKLRATAGIDAAMVKDRDQAFSEGKEQGLKDVALWDYVQSRAGLNDAQRKAFEQRMVLAKQFKMDVMTLLTPEQKKSMAKVKLAKPLFHGNNLDAFTVEDGFAPYRLEGNVIVGRTVPESPNTFLTTKKTYGDFILSFEVKVDGALNSGVQIRSFDRTTDEGKHKAGRFHGPQVEIEASPGSSGFVYGEAMGTGWLSPDEKEHEHFKNGEWNAYKIIAKGPRITVYVNGQLISDHEYPEAYKSHPAGHIGLQVHSTAAKKLNGAEFLEVRWRELRIIEL